MSTLQHYIRDIKDFPKPGILFKDITPLLQDAEAINICLKALVSLVGNQSIDKVVGMESRGFFFGTLLAQSLNAGFVPARKAGKLPFHKLSQTYRLEYGENTLEIHKDAITKGDRVLIHDDVLATGGTAEAVCNLVKQLGGQIVQCNFIMQLTSLNGKDKLKHHTVKSVLNY